MCIGNHWPAVGSGLCVTCGPGPEDAVEIVCALLELVDDTVGVLMQGTAKLFSSPTFVILSIFDCGDSPITGRLKFSFRAAGRIGVIRFRFNALTRRLVIDLEVE